MTKSGTSLVLLGGDNNADAAKLCAYEDYDLVREWRALASWPKAEKVLYVNNTPIVYFGRTQKNKPIYWQRSTEVSVPLGGCVHRTDYLWVQTDDTYYGELAQRGMLADIGFYNDLWEKVYEITNWLYIDGKIAFGHKPDGSIDYRGDGTLGKYERIERTYPYYIRGVSSRNIDIGGFTNYTISNGTGDGECSIWRDEYGSHPVSIAYELTPPEHKSEYLSNPKDKLHYNVSVEDGVLTDYVWATMRGETHASRMNGTSISHGNSTVFKAVMFSVGTDTSGALVVDARAFSSSNRRSVFSYLDVIERETVSEIICEVRDYQEEED
ncbi:MAG: hypothetical protein IJI35_10170 [Kiritimatiellae bacterium]|nr:hypothetical protein [Kiritimatiellia bacterium]